MKNQKQLPFLLLLSVLVITLSCKKDNLDDELPNPDALIVQQLVGSWEMISFTSTVNRIKVFPNDVSIESQSEVIGEDIDYNVMFTSTSFEGEGSYSVTINNESNGFSSTLTDSYVDVFREANFTVENGVITVSGSFYELDIEGLPATTETQEMDVNLSNNGNTLTIYDEALVERYVNGVISTSTSISTSVWAKQ